MKTCLSIWVCVLFIPSLVAAQEQSSGATEAGLKVEKAVAATAMEDRQPLGENTEFDSVITHLC